MSFEQLLQEHIKALRENTKALREYTASLKKEDCSVTIEHSKSSACAFCGITYKTLQSYQESGLITPVRRRGGSREYFRENDLVALCEGMKLYSGEYGLNKTTR